MAKTIAGKDVLVWAKRSGDTGFMKVMCQIDMTLTLSRDVNSEQTKCGTSKQTGPLDATCSINVEGRVDAELGADEISVQDFMQMAIDDEEFEFEAKDPNGAFYLSSTTVKLSQVEVTADSTTNLKFSSNLEFMEPDNITIVETT